MITVTCNFCGRKSKGDVHHEDVHHGAADDMTAEQTFCTSGDCGVHICMRCVQTYSDIWKGETREGRRGRIRSRREKRRGWINVYENSNGKIYTGVDVFPTERQADLAGGDKTHRVGCFEWVEPTKGE